MQQLYDISGKDAYNLHNLKEISHKLKLSDILQNTYSVIHELSGLRK